MLARLVQSGLVEAFEYNDGTRTIALSGWRDFRPVDMTSAERKRRFRRRLYGPDYYGTEGDVMEVQLPSESADRGLSSDIDDEVAAIETEGRAYLEALKLGER
jgi:hypothetical protein